MTRGLRTGRAAARAATLLMGLLGCAWGGALAAGPEALSIEPAHVPKNTAPASAPARIRGIGFTPATTVSFDGAAAAVTFVDSRTLDVQVPTSATGKVSTVTVADAGLSDTLYPFIYTDLVLHVRPTGNDGSNGSTPALAKRTIGGALDVTSVSTTTLIKVSAGTYPEFDLAIFSGVVLSGGWDLAHAQRSPDQFVTVLDAGRQGFAIRSGGLDAAQIIDGVTIANGQRDGLGGGGVVISGDNTVISNSVLVGNTSSSRGGGVYAVFTTSYGGSPVVSGSVLLGNRSFSNSGGAIGVYPFYTQGQVVDMAISDNHILGNRSFNNRGGGVGLGTQALYTYNVLRMQLVGNMLGDNKAAAGAGAAFVSAGAGDRYEVLLDNNLLFGNTASGEGGGLLFSGVGHFSGRVSGSTIAGNSAGLDGGGGIRFSPSPLYEPGFAAENLIVWGNANGNLSGAPLATYSDVQGGAAGTGNIAVNPGFTAGPMGAYYLAQDGNTISPAVDAGSDLAVAHSMEGRTTSASLTLDSGMVDMGFHYPADLGPSADPIAFGRIDPPAGDLGGSDWVLVRGAGFDPGATVTFDGQPAADLIYVSPRRLLARPPSHAPGPVAVTITNPDASAVTQPAGYAYVDNQPPGWTTTVGLQSIGLRQDCVRSAVLSWNPAADLSSPPVKYTIHREECVANTGDFRNPCANFSYFPTASNRVTTTTETFYVDTNFGSGGADPRYIYMVRAADSAVPLNMEFNYSKRLATVGRTTGDLTPPAQVGGTLELLSLNELDWTGAVGAVSYRVYRQAAASAYATPGLTPLITLTTANNDADGNGITDSRYVDTAIPAVDAAFYYKVTALDPCNNETTAELLP
ncbi:MAG TPA: IPT/TIG domain-containing protein [Candidatus Polarisedimenticolia bacterium]|nr:IPT/TIG domain-containing protein [Candidatus Polarisedimenticolia bacterium]